ncbi:hypothetical protein L226DRAFT_537196 [Lentinus tigrinus ALCF2SS1-7]|uniref:uncharacterized protein n=1 Tax=Lentinus tigrinus ALCF2SS1-7 TaxID=1328758 RepID=UPI001165E21D|nr:hypothetical protein L226DRAFT_537196 [Lentinus tigrinus ALCF2SS1-7]
MSSTGHSAAKSTVDDTASHLDSDTPASLPPPGPSRAIPSANSRSPIKHPSRLARIAPILQFSNSDAPTPLHHHPCARPARRTATRALGKRAKPPSH